MRIRPKLAKLAKMNPIKVSSFRLLLFSIFYTTGEVEEDDGFEEGKLMFYNTGLQGKISIFVCSVYEKNINEKPESCHRIE